MAAGIYEYSLGFPLEYDVRIGNGHGGPIREGDRAGLNRLLATVGAPVDG